MVREDTVAVRLKEGVGMVTVCAGQRFCLSLEPGAVATRWADDSPIFRTEFEAVLEPEGLFEIAQGDNGNE